MPLPIIVVTALSILFVMAGAPLTDYLYGWALLSDIQVLGAACGIAFFIYPGARTRIAMTVSAVLTMITLVGIPLGGAILYFFWISSAGQQYFVDWSKQGR